jgi:hypothetical protein
MQLNSLWRDPFIATALLWARCRWRSHQALQKPTSGTQLTRTGLAGIISGLDNQGPSKLLRVDSCTFGAAGPIAPDIPHPTAFSKQYLPIAGLHCREVLLAPLHLADGPKSRPFGVVLESMVLNSTSAKAPSLRLKATQCHVGNRVPRGLTVNGLFHCL